MVVKKFHPFFVGLSALSIKCVSDGLGKEMSSIPTDHVINFLQSTYQVQNGLPGVVPASSSTKVGAASKGAILVDEASRGDGVKKRAGPIGAFGNGFSAGGAECLRSKLGFAACQVWNFSGELKLATGRAAHAVSGQRTCLKVSVDSPHVSYGIFQEFSGWVGCGHRFQF
jgi:hypothetical protein